MAHPIHPNLTGTLPQQRTRQPVESQRKTVDESCISNHAPSKHQDDYCPAFIHFTCLPLILQDTGRIVDHATNLAVLEPN
jgi:hypothetical protein